jgi:hypothetical protein
MRMRRILINRCAAARGIILTAAINWPILIREALMGRPESIATPAAAVSRMSIRFGRQVPAIFPNKCAPAGIFPAVIFICRKPFGIRIPSGIPTYLYCFLLFAHNILVIPAKAGIHESLIVRHKSTSMDPCLRRDDVKKMGMTSKRMGMTEIRIPWRRVAAPDAEKPVAGVRPRAPAKKALINGIKWFIVINR